jgi:hypothetical protein
MMAVWLLMVNKQRRLGASHTRMVQSLLPLTKRALGSALWAGSHAWGSMQEVQQQHEG